MESCNEKISMVLNPTDPWDRPPWSSCNDKISMVLNPTGLWDWPPWSHGVLILDSNSFLLDFLFYFLKVFVLFCIM